MRHLIYHLMPVATAAGRACWQWHLRQVCHRVGVIDGRRLFAVVTGPGLDPVGDVVRFLPAGAEVIVLPNHPDWGEAYTLPLLLARTYTVAPDDAVLFGHAKGVTRVDSSGDGAAGDAAAIRWWSLSMYRWLFDPSVVAAAGQAAAIGWLLFDGPVPTFPPWSRWHYPGTFFWFRAGEIFGRNWWSVLPARYGAEAYLSGLVEPSRAACRLRVTWSQYFGPHGARVYFREFWEQIGVPTGADADSYDGAPA